MFCSKKTTKPDTARYVTKVEKADLWLEVAYCGGTWRGQQTPKNTVVTVRCLRKANVHCLRSPWIELWTKQCGNPSMPSGPWNGIKLSEIHADRFFLGISNNLMEVIVDSGKVIWETKTGNTPIYHIFGVPQQDLLIVFNGYYGFEHEEKLGNIAAYDLNGHEIWRVQTPSEGDIFANAPCYEDGVLKSASWDGFTCSIDVQNGNILDQKFTK
jgi:outer membrane protein assembly factor BamB